MVYYSKISISPQRTVTVFIQPSPYRFPPNTTTRRILYPLHSSPDRENQLLLAEIRAGFARLAPRGPIVPCVILPSLLIYVLLAFIRAPPPRRFKRVALKMLSFSEEAYKKTVPRRVTSPSLTCRLITCIK